MPKKLLIIGCGDIGFRLGQELQEYKVTGLRRSPSSANEALSLRQCDGTDIDALSAILAEGFDAIVATYTPGAASEQAYQSSYVAGAKALLAALGKSGQSLEKLIWVSSSRVYGQEQGAWVDEFSPTEPKGYAGIALLAAERILAEADVPLSVVRFSGIYGPGRDRLLKSVKAGDGGTEAYSNRIHIDDCVGFLAHLLRSEKSLEPLYLASDCEPVKQTDIRRWLAEQMKVPLPFAEKAALTPLRGSKRCDNSGMLASAYVMKYPSFREGYQAVLQDLE